MSQEKVNDIRDGFTKKDLLFFWIWSKHGPMGGEPKTGSSGQDGVRAGTFWGVLNVSLCASGTQLGLDMTSFMTGSS